MDQQKEYFDPCGMEATDDIVSRVVGEQVDKIQGLLARVLQKHNKDGKHNAPLVKLGTACSGTDAPALALTLIKEQWEQRSGLPSAGDFAFTHAFSCENDPFKQAYLARNFDSTLYPDIAKMTAAEPRDVYGQVQPIPDFNWFVAVTSCKNFSSLRSKFRLDIEDKGCSGETFLAAVEILFQEKPQITIFENVQAAPWVSGSIGGRAGRPSAMKLTGCLSTSSHSQRVTFALLVSFLCFLPRGRRQRCKTTSRVESS
jgi:hypothetical protein